MRTKWSLEREVHGKEENKVIFYQFKIKKEFNMDDRKTHAIPDGMFEFYFNLDAKGKKHVIWLLNENQNTREKFKKEIIQRNLKQMEQGK